MKADGIWCISPYSVAFFMRINFVNKTIHSILYCGICTLLYSYYPCNNKFAICSSLKSEQMRDANIAYTEILPYHLHKITCKYYST
jgi:hypothetical protein